MKMVSQLYNRHLREDNYVVGTGASLRVFPLDFLSNKIVIGLNQAWKILPITYGITIHPDLNIPEFMAGEKSYPDIIWISGNKKTQALLKGEQLTHALENFYFFNYHGKPNHQPAHEPSESGRIIDWVKNPTEDYLYVWSSIAQAGANLAANMGAKNIIMVGCDNCSLGENHHSHNQHTRWKGVDPQHRYQQYYEGIAEVRQALRGRGVNLVSLNPFLKLDAPDLDFLRLCQELNVESKIKEVDISPSHKNFFQKMKDWF